jgi:hypothetical protein
MAAALRATGRPIGALTPAGSDNQSACNGQPGEKRVRQPEGKTAIVTGAGFGIGVGLGATLARWQAGRPGDQP